MPENKARRPRTWDDIVEKDERGAIYDTGINVIEKRTRCPYLKRLDNWFLYCEARAQEFVGIGAAKFTGRPRPDSAQYQARLEVSELQLWCLCGEEQNRRCINFPEPKEK